MVLVARQLNVFRASNSLLHQLGGTWYQYFLLLSGAAIIYLLVHGTWYSLYRPARKKPEMRL